MANHQPQEAPPGLLPPAAFLGFAAMVRRLWPFARPYRVAASVVLAASLMEPAVEAAGIWLFKLVVDRILVSHELRLLGPVAAAYLGLTVVGALLGLGTRYLATSVSERFILSMRMALFERLQGLSLDTLERRRLGDLLSCLTSDISAIEGFLISGFVDALVHVVRVLVFAAALFYLHWRLAVIAFLVSPVFWVVARKVSGRLRAFSRERRRHGGALTSVAEESLSNAPLVRAYCREQWELARFAREGEGGLQAQMAAARVRAIFSPLVDLLELVAGLAVLAVGAWEISSSRLTLGSLLVFVTYLGKLYGPVRGLTSYWNSAHSAAASAERILDLLDQPMAEGAIAGVRRMRQPRGEVIFDEVEFRYPGAARPALRGISFRLEPGSSLAFVGPSGAGKSTIIKLLLRFHEPTRGRILLDGIDLRELEVTSLRSAMAVVLQETLVFHATVRENIAYGRAGATEAEIERAARLADAHDFVSGLPEGYSTVVRQRGRLLSGGERQRIAIARAVLRNAPVLLLDEPTTGLDAESAERILAPLRRVMSGHTTIVVSHDLRCAREATRVIVLEGGRIVESGAPAELACGNGRYAALERLQSPPAIVEPAAGAVS